MICRAWASICQAIARVGHTQRLGLESRCPHCGSRVTIKYGWYTRHPWELWGTGDGTGTAASVPRVPADVCRDFAVVSTAELVLSGGAAGGGGSLAAPGHVLRRTAGSDAFVDGASGALATMAPAGVAPRWTVHRWLEGVRGNGRLREACRGNWRGSGDQELGTDGLWAKLEGGKVVRVVLMASGQRQWPDLSACGGTERGARGRMGRLAGAHAQAAGLDLQKLRGICSDGANGLWRTYGMR